MSDGPITNPQALWSPRLWLAMKILIPGTIIGLLVMLAWPAVYCSRNVSRRSTCKNNLKQLGLALHNYHDTQNSLPPGAASETSYGWTTYLLPYLDQATLAERIDVSSQPMRDRHDVEGEVVYTFLCPSSDAPVTLPDTIDFGPFAYSAYRGCAGTSYDARDGVLFPIDDAHPPITLDDVTDGTTYTLMVGETHSPRTWDPKGKPEAFAIWAGTNGRWENTLGTVAAMPNTSALDAFGSAHEGGLHVLRSDGSVLFISDDINSDIYRALGTRSGGEDIENEIF